MLKINDKDVKFDFRAYFRANSILSSAPNANDGASQLWIKFVTGDEMAVHDALNVLLPDVGENDIFDLLDKYEESGKMDKLREDLQAELFASGFFHRAAKRLVSFMEKYQKPKKAKTDEEKQAQQLQHDTLEELKKSLS